jgi:hypothetical protein
LVKPAPQVVPQTPRTQNCPNGQALPHAPQCWMSLVVSAQTSPPPIGPASAPGVAQGMSSSLLHRMWQRPCWQL